MSAGSPRIDAITLTVASISPRTRWTFLELADAHGLVGTGEATLNGREDALIEAGTRVLAGLPGTDLSVEMAKARPLPDTLAAAAIRSALDQALTDLVARRRDVPLWRELASANRDPVPVYANINRRTVDRTPEGFAESARKAIADGHAAFKIAPFDEATADARAASALGPAAVRGFERIAAVRAAIGPAARLMVDCHWRFDAATAEEVVLRAAELGLHWVECPLPETPEHLAALRRLRGIANARGVRLAGCEEAIGEAGFAPFIAAGAYDVIMPDVKYVGGFGEFMRLAESAVRAGVLVSPHNPSGPISHAMSLHLSSVLPGCDRLEMQFDETPLFDRLVRETIPVIVDGAARLPPGAGSGITLAQGVLASCAMRRAVFRAGGRVEITP